MTIDLEILSGVGKLYVADVGATFPEVDEEPNETDWLYLGETLDGVKATLDQKVVEFGTDQRTGKIKASRTEETLMLESKLAQFTAENIATAFGTTVTDTAASAGHPGTREVGLSRGFSVAEYAFLFRGNSPYGATFAAQYEVPRGYFGGSQAIEYTKDKQQVIPFEFHALSDLNATDAANEYGRWIGQDAIAGTT